MAKDKKRREFNIKTAKYFTKTCSNCKKEYPNWFTNCPNCNTPWDSDLKEEQEAKTSPSKNIKIIAKISEEDFDSTIETVQLVFSADNGESWYQIKMDNEEFYYIAEIPDVSQGSVIIYYIEVNFPNGEKVIENNDNNFFLYHVGESQDEETIPVKNEKEFHIEPSNKIVQLSKKEEESGSSPKPIIKEGGLKICPFCKSRIKSSLHVCPICGKQQN